MPAASLEAQRIFSRRHYENNREYYVERNRVARQKIRDFINEAKSVPCADCGVEYRPHVMQFDHKGDKAFNVSEMAARRMSLSKVRDEIAKCDVVCANCHAERTYQRSQ